MTPFHKSEELQRAFASFQTRLVDILGAMDHAFGVAAAQLGFVCNGCEENCCRSRFYHYTCLEYFYLFEGFSRLEPSLRASMRQSALKVRQFDQVRHNGITRRPLCPLNLEGRCSLYSYRPMICRLHGLPHKLQRPGREPLCGPGCDAFERGRGNAGDVRLDRTPFYRQLAALELKFKQEAGMQQKLKMTVAEIIISFDTP